MADKYNFDTAFQFNILTFMVKEKNFVRNNIELFNPKFFDNNITRLIAKLIVEYIEKYKINPTVEVLKEEVKKLDSIILQQEEKDLCSHILDLVKTTDISQVREYIIDNVVIFGKKSALTLAAIKISKLIERNDFDKVEDVLKEAARVGSGIDKERYNFFEKVDERIQERLLPLEKKIATGFAPLDTVLSGGLANKQFGYIMAPTNSGKSISLCNLAVNAMKNGEKVIYITLEMTEKAIAKRIDSILSGVVKNKIVEMVDMYKQNIGGIKLLGGDLEIVHKPAGTLNCNQIVALVESYRRLYNFETSLLIIDYGDILAPNHRTSEKRIDQNNIFTELFSLAQQLDLPIWSASQGDTDSLKRQEKGQNLSLTNFSEGSGKLHAADVVISMINPKTDINTSSKERVLQYKVIKNRDGACDVPFQAIVDFNTFTIRITSEQNDDYLNPSTTETLSKISESTHSIGLNLQGLT